MARRSVQGGRVSPIYATIGPSMSTAIRYCDGDAAAAAAMRGEWEEWRDRYQLAWSRGKATPPPPYHDTLGAGYARPTA